ncbi:hypothetical protein QR680_012532 [Steinernema hermaphroditum]|uniref:Uncharacterized protein n=1 Tax=Steinernema hermaphroditum TaxID=289476 RepID=A0AA39M0W6_9BILA|nr:hypothetical protein QR680_012532 [Steinernema hermaphroditum]
MRSFVFFAAFLTTVSALCNVTDMSNYQLNSAGKGADEVWRLVIFVERDVPSHQIKIQAKFVELLLCRLSAAGVFLRSEVPQLKKLSDAIIRRTNNYERNATLRWGLLQPIDGMLIPPISTAERIQLAFFDVLVFLFAAALVYTSLASSYLVGLQHLEIIRSFNALAHLNRRIRHEV